MRKVSTVFLRSVTVTNFHFLAVAILHCLSVPCPTSFATFLLLVTSFISWPCWLGLGEARRVARWPHQIFRTQNTLSLTLDLTDLWTRPQSILDRKEERSPHQVVQDSEYQPVPVSAALWPARLASRRPRPTATADLIMFTCFHILIYISYSYYSICFSYFQMEDLGSGDVDVSFGNSTAAAEATPGVEAPNYWALLLLLGRCSKCWHFVACLVWLLAVQELVSSFSKTNR